MMDWQNQNQTHQQQMEPPNGFGGLYVKVMTDEQMELLRRQISVYASICEKLVEMHKAISTQQDLTGMRLGNLYCDPLMISGGHKISARQRWTPTPVQLQILERIFDEGNGTPSKQKIKEITNELTQHGPISETNVYNWFQNRRARSKRKLSVSVANNAESEVETDVESPKEKAKMENIQSHENSASRIESMYLQSHEISADMFGFDGHPSKGEPIFLSDTSLRPTGSFEHLSMMPNLRLDHLTGEMDVPASYSPYFNGEGYDDVVG